MKCRIWINSSICASDVRERTIVVFPLYSQSRSAVSQSTIAKCTIRYFLDMYARNSSPRMYIGLLSAWISNNSFQRDSYRKLASGTLGETVNFYYRAHCRVILIRSRDSSRIEEITRRWYPERNRALVLCCKAEFVDESRWHLMVHDKLASLLQNRNAERSIPFFVVGTPFLHKAFLQRDAFWRSDVL